MEEPEPRSGMRLFRKIRQSLLAENKLKRYLLYAIGEIFLVVIGILIAVQINNWNEVRKKGVQREIYEASLINELENDIQSLNRLDSLAAIKRGLIRSYLDYYNSDRPNLDTLHYKRNSIISTKIAFYSSAYTIDDLLTTGNISLFSKEKKASIIELKNILDRYAFYETSTIQDVALYEQEIKKNFDLVNYTGLSDKEHPNTANWKLDLTSDQFRILNNTLVESLKLFEFQSEMYESILEATEELLFLLRTE